MTTVTTCEHYTKVRLLAADPRIWECIGTTNTKDGGCKALMVEGRPWKGEPRWIPLGITDLKNIDCEWCIDGFCTSLDNKPCPQCSRADSARGESR